LRLHLVGQVTGVFHAPALGRENEFCAEGLHGLRAFNAQILRHDQHHAVALDGSGHGQCDACVTGGGLDQRVARVDVAPFLRALDHGQRGTVFHRARRVVAFQLAQYHVAVLTAGLRTDALQRHQWRLADDVLDGLVDRLGCSLGFWVHGQRCVERRWGRRPARKHGASRGDAKTGLSTVP